MSLHLEFEPHSWFMDFAIQDNRDYGNGQFSSWVAYTENGMHYIVDKVKAPTLELLKNGIRNYHLKAHNGYGERIAAKRLKSIGESIAIKFVSYGEIAELQSLAYYVKQSGDATLMEWANIAESQD